MDCNHYLFFFLNEKLKQVMYSCGPVSEGGIIIRPVITLLNNSDFYFVFSYFLKKCITERILAFQLSKEKEHLHIKGLLFCSGEWNFHGLQWHLSSICRCSLEEQWISQFKRMKIKKKNISQTTFLRVKNYA